MGSAQSYISSEVTLTVAVALASVAALGYTKYSATTAQETSPLVKKSGKKKKTLVAGNVLGSASVSSTPIIPGGFSIPVAPSTSTSQSLTDAVPAKSKKGKKKKSLKPTMGSGLGTVDNRDYHSETSVSSGQPIPNSMATRHSLKNKQPSSASESSGQLSKPLLQSTTSISMDTDGSWTRVEPQSRRRQQQVQSRTNPTDAARGGPPVEITTSDAGLTTSVTGGSSSPIAEQSDKGSASQASSTAEQSNRRSLREKPASKQRKKSIADNASEASETLLDVSSDRSRVHPPHTDNRQPATGFSWADYEDAPLEDTVGGGNDGDADGEDDGWGVVKSRGRSKHNKQFASQPPSQSRPTKAPETLTQKQRQNASKREALKALRAEGESQRLATLSKHRAEAAAAAKATELYSSGTGKGKKGGKVVSGGMDAGVDERGNLVWN